MKYRRKMAPAGSSSSAVGEDVSLMTLIDNTFGFIPLDERKMNNIYNTLEQKGLSTDWTEGQMISVLHGPYLLYGIPVGFM